LWDRTKELISALHDSLGALHDLLGALHDLLGALHDLLGALQDLISALEDLINAIIILCIYGFTMKIRLFILILQSISLKLTGFLMKML
jgi:hypothetical protein